MSQELTQVFDIKMDEEYMNSSDSVYEMDLDMDLDDYDFADEGDNKVEKYEIKARDVIEETQPEYIKYDDIYITLGSPWVPTYIIDDFIMYVTGCDWNVGASCDSRIRHDDHTGSWEVKKDYYFVPFKVNQKYGTPRREMLDILTRTLNMQPVAVYDQKSSNYTKSGTQRVFNKAETIHAIEKQKLLIDTFVSWVWSDSRRRNKLEELYNEKYASTPIKHYNGSVLKFKGMNEEVDMYPYQKDAVARIIFSSNTLLAHDVGSGKTYIMAAAGMEMRKMGLSDKNLYVVPNNIIGQWRSIFEYLYPDADIMVVEPKDFTPAKREKTLLRIRMEDHDAIIMAYSCFSLIPVSVDSKIAALHREIAECQEEQKQKGRRTQRLARRIEKLREKAADLVLERKKEGLCFDQLGITRLFVDEAHNFKNVPIDSKIENVMGITKSGSAKCKDMLQKVRIVQHFNEGGGVIFATGTPITNSITDVYIMQLYLQGGMLSLLELESFDSWVGMFAEPTTGFEIDVDTSKYRIATRFACFHNIPELTNLLFEVADFHQMDAENGIPVSNGYTDVLISRTKAFADYLKDISKRADLVRSGRIKRKEDNMLLITTDGRKAALDLRLVDDKSGFTTFSKVFRCAEEVSRIYQATAADNSTQLVFCDTSTPKEGFNIYDELKSLLVKMGVDEDKIAYIHDAATEKAKEKLYKNMREGLVRVLIGSTFKLGLGVNVQDKLIALHHLDVPWRPADMVQREGRILRQGNSNPVVYLYRYITEGSFDAYSWQLLETKQRFIADLLSGTSEKRSGSDVDGTVLSYAEVKALAVGNPLIKQRVEVANELTKLRILQKKQIDQKYMFRRQLAEIPEKIEKMKALVDLVRDDAEYLKGVTEELDKDARRQLREEIYNACHEEEPLSDEVIVTLYKGFEIVAPVGSWVGEPNIIIRRSSKYFLGKVTSEVGCLTRVDNLLDDISGKRLRELEQKENELINSKAFMEKELARTDDYTMEILRCQNELNRIDNELGVEEN